MKTYLKLLAVMSTALIFPSLASASFINSAADASLVGGNVIDFEGQVAGTYASISIDDVTFSALDNNLRIDGTYQQYNQTGLYLDNGTYSGNGFSSLNIDFNGGTDAFGFNWGMAESWADWELTAYDSGNAVLESYTLASTGGSNAGEFFGIASAGISYATLSWAGDYDWVAIDNFTYSVSIPEPATLTMLALGLFGLSAARRRQRS